MRWGDALMRAEVSYADIDAQDPAAYLRVSDVPVFHARYDAFALHYGELFDSLQSATGAERLGVPIVGPEDGHHNIAELVAGGRQVFAF